MVLLLDAYPCQQWQTQPLPDEQRMLDALLRMGGLRLRTRRSTPSLATRWWPDWGRRGVRWLCSNEQVVSAMIELVGHNNRLIREPVDYCYHGEVIFIEASASRQPWLDGRGWESLTKGRSAMSASPVCIRRWCIPTGWQRFGALIGERVDGVGQQPHIRQKEDA